MERPNALRRQVLYPPELRAHSMSYADLARFAATAALMWPIISSSLAREYAPASTHAFSLSHTQKRLPTRYAF
jgi:hypothetical protein